GLGGTARTDRGARHRQPGSLLHRRPGDLPGRVAHRVQERVVALRSRRPARRAPAAGRIGRGREEPGMSLKYALLALIRIGPMSGYDLQKQFSLSVGHVWHARDSQIYPELRRMETNGLIEGEEQKRGERGTRRIYHITRAG